MEKAKDQGKDNREKDKRQRSLYETPAIKYKGILKIRAGSTPLGVSPFEDPASAD